MSDVKICPKCQQEMEKGTLQQTGRFGETPFAWEDAEENRIKLAACHCKNCGLVEIYAPPKK